MKTLGYYNGRIDELDRMTVPMSDRACYFGDGVYDVAFSRNHKIYALEEHVHRFLICAEKIGIKPNLSEDRICVLLNELVQKLEDDSLWVYFQYSRGTAPRNHAFPENAEPNLWIMIRPMQIKDTYRVLSCIQREDTRAMHCDIKSLNLLPSVLATQAATEAGCDECIFHRGEIVTECAHSNISILQNGKLITHPADEKILAGTGRAHLMLACRHFGIPVVEREYTMTELLDAEEILITSASALCMRVGSVDGKKVGGKASYTVKQLQDYLLDDFLKKTEL